MMEIDPTVEPNGLDGGAEPSCRNRRHPPVSVPRCRPIARTHYTRSVGTDLDRHLRREVRDDRQEPTRKPETERCSTRVAPTKLLTPATIPKARSLDDGFTTPDSSRARDGGR